MLKIELLFISIKNIVICTNDYNMPNIIKKIYPYFRIIDCYELNFDSFVTINKVSGYYSVKYKHFEYNNLSVNSIYYFLYEIIQVIVEEYVISNSINVLHGACVEKNGKAYAFSAKTNTGKSTLVTELLNYKYNYISDDYIILNRENDKVIPLHIPIKLRSVNQINNNIANQIIVRDYNPVRSENYYLIKPSYYCENKPFTLQGFFQINRNKVENRIISLDYKDSYKTIILNSKISVAEAIKNISVITLSLIRTVQVYHIDYITTKDCINLIESVI